MNTVILNGNNVVSGSNNSKYTYTFPSGSVKFDNHEIAVAGVNIYYSWFNITSANSNNTLSYKWTNASGTSTYSITITDGFYSVSDLNSYLQSQMISNGHYLLDSNGDYVYYLEIQENSTYYAIQVNCYAVPTALPSGYSNPASMTFPSSASTPQLVIPSTSIADYFGISAGTYPSSVQTSDYSTKSSYTPQVTPVQSVLLSCNLVNNQYSIPNNIIYSFTSGGTDFGSIIESKPNSFAWQNISQGSYNSLTIQFLDQDFSNLVIQDSNIVITLVFRERK